jgi:hypothetical protein
MTDKEIKQAELIDHEELQAELSDEEELAEDAYFAKLVEERMKGPIVWVDHEDAWKQGASRD